MAIAGAAVAATIESIPDWGRWTLAGIALAGVAVLGIAVLIGPAARRLAGERHPLTQDERGQMTATERVEAVNAARHTLIQAATGLVVIGGVVFTAQGLWYTAQSLDASRQAQRTAEQGQITDRYTKAVEQLGSAKQDVRLGGIYALQRLAADSPRDKDTIRNVLAAFVRNRDFCVLRAGQKAPPAHCTPEAPAEQLDKIPDRRLDEDVFAALTLVPHLAPRDPSGAFTVPPHFARVRFPRADLSYVNLAGVDLAGADLRRANLLRANLLRAYLSVVNLSGANLHNTYLNGADLSAANLRGADLNVADLSGADLSGADLSGAFLSGADLSGADLRGADLQEVKGATEQDIRRVAITDAATRF
ncbi:pentapeptide repeat-containing protein [Nonomuraea sp. ATR24]|uniref:pentapeptide repeat-containing protein n=1 Tax=unclassified Nonomuraea TaxID=2593643 RepID=UPI0033DADBAD